MPASIKHLTDKKLNLTSLLARWKDGLYYTAAILECDKANKKCLVCFTDGTEIWANNRDVHIQLSLDQLNEDEDIVCCICDDGQSEPPNEIILCDVCQQGYHQKCHNPPVDSSKIDESEDTSDHKDWFCATCSYILNQSNRAKSSANAQQPTPPPKQQAHKLLTQPTPQPKPKPKPQQPQSQQQQTQTRPQAAPKQIPEPVVTQKQPAKIKQTPTVQQLQKSSNVGPVKSSSNQSNKQAPYYPLSNQVRATGSTAALASMTASSALVVGSSAGRTKQDLVNQSNRTSQRQRPASNVSVEPTNSPPVKHAVRKSSVNFTLPPVKQSALPTATRSVILNPAEPQGRTPHPTSASTTSTSISTITSQQLGSGSNSSSSNAKNSSDLKSKNVKQAPSSNNDVKLLAGSVPRSVDSPPVKIPKVGNTALTYTSLTSGQTSGGGLRGSQSESPTPSYTTNTSGKNFSIIPTEIVNTHELSRLDGASNINSSVKTASVAVIVQADSSQLTSNNHGSS